jgi:class 3 adenylate cyclase
VPDLEAYRAAGLYDPASPTAADREALLAYLEAEGCTLEEMKTADARGRLFALAGDRKIFPVAEVWTLAELADRLGQDLDEVHMVWRAYGLVVPHDPDIAVAGPADLEAVRTFFMVRAGLGQEPALAMARVCGATMARFGDAASASVRSGNSAMMLTNSGSEVATARAYGEATAIVDRIGALLDVLMRHHLVVARRHFEQSESADVVAERGVRMGVGFADLSGFTRTSAGLPMDELSRLMSGLEDITLDVVGRGGGRVVKYIGDAVMFVAPRLEQLVEIALALSEHPAAAAVGMPVRVGISFGTLLAQEGDYFGAPVNLASRLVALVEPGAVLADAALAARADPERVVAEEPFAAEVRGWDEPVQVARLRRAASVTPNPVR